MIKAMGGRLRVESREGVGSRFTITLPAPEAAALLGASGTANAIKDEVANG